MEEGGRGADRASEKLSQLRRQVNGLRIQRKDYLKDLVSRCITFLQDNGLSSSDNRIDFLHLWAPSTGVG